MAVGLINAAKELTRGYQPFLLSEFVFTDGTVLRCSTHGLTAADGGFQYGGNDYHPRILNQEIAATQILSEQGIALPPSVSIVLNDADRYVWTNYEKTRGFKGAKLSLRFVFWNVGQNDFSSDYLTPFVGLCSAPSVDETTLTVRAVSLLNMEQTLLPTIRVQKTCPWIFPKTAEERTEAAGSSDSWFSECGYSPDVEGGRGNFESGSTPFAKCNYTKADCVLRGMWEKDGLNRKTGRFGGVQWDPPQSFRSRGYISGKWEEGFNTSNEAKYNDHVPFVYGTAWVDPIILNVVGDANSTRFEALVCFGEVEDVLKVIVNDVELPAASTMTRSPLQVADKLFCWRVVNRGGRDGQPLQDALYDGKGDPYGSLCVIQCVVPRRLADSSSVPRVRVLVRGPRIRKYRRIASVSVAGEVATVTFDSANEDVASNDPAFAFEISGCSLAGLNRTWTGLTNWTYGPPGTVTFNCPGIPDGSGVGGVFLHRGYSENPAHILMDVLVWANWSYADLDVQSFVDAAAWCAASVSYQNQFGQSGTHPRYACSTVLRQRRSAAEIVKGICGAMNAILVPNVDGKLQVFIKRTLAEQQPAQIAGSNHNAAVASKKADGTAANGYFAYRFDPSNVLRVNGQARLTANQRANSDTPNRVSFTFQDADNNHAFDSINVVDSEALTRAGQEVSGSMPVEGITNYDQARRVIASWMAEAFRGNPRNHPFGDAGGTLQFDLETTFKVIHLKVGHLCSLTWPPLGLEDQLVRVVKIQPAANFETTKVTVQWHSDEWYLDAWGQEDAPLYSAQRRNRVQRPPYPVWIGRHQDFVTQDPFWTDERPDFGGLSALNFGDQVADQYLFRVYGFMPVNTFSTKIRAPFTPLQGTTTPTGGELPGGRSYWVALVGRDEDGKRTPHSTLTRIYVPEGTSTNKVTVSGIDWDAGTAGWDLFAGDDPFRLYCYLKGDGTPASLDWGGPLSATWRRPIPDTEFDVLRLKVRRVLHPGVWEGLVTAVDDVANTITCQGANWTPDAFAGRVVSQVGRFLGSGGLVDEPSGFNWKIVSNTADTLTIDPAFGAPLLGMGDPVAGDLIWVVIRAKADAFSSSAIGDAALSLADGDAQVGRIVRIVSGMGAGQWARIKSVVDSVIEIEGRWETVPDATSIFWIEEPAWAKVQDVAAGEVSEAEPSVYPEFVIDVRGLERQVFAVLPVAVDGGGTETFESAAARAIRDFYLFKDTGIIASVAPTQAAVSINISGTLAIGSDQGPRAVIGTEARASGVRVEVKQAPTGAAITVQLYAGGNPWMTLTIPAGQTSATATESQLNAAPTFSAGANIRVDLTTVGTTFPGSDLGVFIYL